MIAIGTRLNIKRFSLCGKHQQKPNFNCSCAQYIYLRDSLPCVEQKSVAFILISGNSVTQTTPQQVAQELLNSFVLSHCRCRCKINYQMSGRKQKKNEMSIRSPGNSNSISRFVRNVVIPGICTARCFVHCYQQFHQICTSRC